MWFPFVNWESGREDDDYEDDDDDEDVDDDDDVDDARRRSLRRGRRTVVKIAIKGFCIRQNAHCTRTTNHYG